MWNTESPEQSQPGSAAPSWSSQDRDRNGDGDTAPAHGPLGAVPMQVFRWTGRNDFFVNGDVNLLMVGGGR